MEKPQRIGVIAHPHRAETFPVAEQVADSLRDRGIEVWVQMQWDIHSMRELEANTDMLVAIGGDGAMLRAARTCAPLRIPVLGLNMGYLGFLPEINNPDAWDQHLDMLMDGQYWIEKRMTLEASVIRDGQSIHSGLALNDVVINRTQAIGTVLVQTYIDNYWATTYHADALIIATATGSTAYALAAGGPILPPELHNILIVPVAAHLSMERAIVLSEGATVQVIIAPERSNEVMLAMDGSQLCAVQPNDCIVVRAGEDKGLFVRMRDRNYFYRSLLDRLEPRVPSRATPEHLRIELNEEQLEH